MVRRKPAIRSPAYFAASDDEALPVGFSGVRRATKKGGPPDRPPSSRRSDPRSLVTGVTFVTHETHLGDVRALRDGEHLVHDFIASLRIRLEMKLRNRVHLLGLVKILAEHRHIDRRAVP